MDTDTTTYIVDGYNLIHRGIGFSRGANLHGQRRRLEVFLREFQRRRPGSRIVLVYDGARGVNPLPFAGGPDVREDFEILFSAPPRTADDEVLAQCERRRGAGRIIVVTSDRKDIARNLHGAGVEHIMSESFVCRVEETLKQRGGDDATAPAAPESRAEKPQVVSPEEAEDWYRLFMGSDADEERS